MKKSFKYKLFIKNGLSCGKGRERCASNSLSCDNENLLLVAAFYTPISSVWERPYSREGNTLAVVNSGHVMGSKYLLVT